LREINGLFPAIGRASRCNPEITAYFPFREYNYGEAIVCQKPKNENEFNRFCELEEVWNHADSLEKERLYIRGVKDVMRLVQAIGKRE
jgi:hypothetical protein